MRVVADEVQMFVTKVQQTFKAAQFFTLVFDFQARQRQWLAREQLVHLLQVSFVDVVITECVNEISRFKVANMRHEMSHEGVRADIKGDTQECVGRTLIKLAMKNRARRLARVCSPTVREGRSGILDLELEQRMAWWQVNIVTFARIPTADNQAARVRVSCDFADQTRNLINAIVLWIVSSERTP